MTTTRRALLVAAVLAAAAGCADGQIAVTTTEPPRCVPNAPASPVVVTEVGKAVTFRPAGGTAEAVVHSAVWRDPQHLVLDVEVRAVAGQVPGVYPLAWSVLLGDCWVMHDPAGAPEPVFSTDGLVAPASARGTVAFTVPEGSVDRVLLSISPWPDARYVAWSVS